MATVRRSFKDAALFRFSDEQRSCLDALSDEAIEAAATSDPDAQLLTERQLNRASEERG